MQKSETFTKVAAAFVSAQRGVKIAIKNAVNPHLKNKYADLGAVQDACAQALEDNHLAVAQLPRSGGDDKLHLETVLIHESGEWLSSEIEMPLPKQDPQAYGSALTYARRYGLAAMMGVTQDDEDGVRASASTAEADALAWANALSECPTIESLQSTFTEAYKAAGDDRAYRKIITSAKDARKKLLMETSDGTA
ncbi:ERF family protein [Chitiniphilus shinanonensis]|uniref:ERF family protein n=1 Tax=Chitiniphilus shinanonensis TaxID=553088 RepID=UPI00302979C7